MNAKTQKESLAMERTFLRIARSALIAVITLTLLLTVIAVVYGGIQFLPSEQPKVPQINIKLDDMTAPKTTSISGSESTPSAGQAAGNESGVTKQCEMVTPKLTKIAGQIGWDKKSEQVFNPDTTQYETRNTIDYNESINVNGFCKMTQSLIEEQNSKLSPYFKGINLKDAYYSNLNAFLDGILLDAKRDQALPLDDASKYYAPTSIEWFNNQFANAVDNARESAIQNEAKQNTAKALGTSALYFAGTAFGFFFACCLILVFIRIEVNTKDLVEAIRAFDNKAREAPPK
ncbi:MAG: hypothetical protein ABR912_14610 [Terracidiphilus sp.]|jgi:hypothetical protein